MIQFNEYIHILKVVAGNHQLDRRLLTGPSQFEIATSMFRSWMVLLAACTTWPVAAVDDVCVLVQSQVTTKKLCFGAKKACQTSSQVISNVSSNIENPGVAV